MPMQISVQYHSKPVTYSVMMQEENIYLLRLLEEGENNCNDRYIPEKMVIRKKGKIWISDVEDYPELVDSLTAEITQFGKIDE